MKIFWYSLIMNHPNFKWSQKLPFYNSQLFKTATFFSLILRNFVSIVLRTIIKIFFFFNMNNVTKNEFDQKLLKPTKENSNKTYIFYFDCLTSVNSSIFLYYKIFNCKFEQKWHTSQTKSKWKNTKKKLEKILFY